MNHGTSNENDNINMDIGQVNIRHLTKVNKKISYITL